MPQPPDIIIGADCGGTRTRAVIATTNGAVLGEGQAGPGNPRDIGLDGLREAVARAVEAARRVANRADPAAAAVLGVAGVATEAERASAVEGLAPLGLCRAPLTVVSDMRIAQAGAFACGPGMALIVGTGSCCYGRSADGREWRAGGWGPRLDDAGSATDLGQRAIRAAIRAADGRGPETVLSSRVLEELGLGSLRDALALVEQAEARPRIAALAPLVLQAAHEGDRVSVAIVREGVQGLAEMVLAVSAALGSADAPPLPLCLLGGLAEHDPTLAARLSETLHVAGYSSPSTAPLLPPSRGAAAMALAGLGLLTPGSIAAFRASSDPSKSD